MCGPRAEVDVKKYLHLHRLEIDSSLDGVGLYARTIDSLRTAYLRIDVIKVFVFIFICDVMAVDVVHCQDLNREGHQPISARSRDYLILFTKSSLVIIVFYYTPGHVRNTKHSLNDVSSNITRLP